MIGIDGEFALLQLVRALLTYQQKTTTAKKFSAADELKELAYGMIFGSSKKAYAFA